MHEYSGIYNRKFRAEVQPVKTHECDQKLEDEKQDAFGMGGFDGDEDGNDEDDLTKKWPVVDLYNVTVCVVLGGFGWRVEGGFDENGNEKYDDELTKE